MSKLAESLPKDLAAAHAMILAERAARDVECTARLAAEAAVAQAHTDRIVLDLELERLRFQLAKARREAFGQSSEAGARIGQFELALEDIEVTLAAMEAADTTATPVTTVDGFTRRKPARRPLPDHLPRVRQVYPSPSACLCCGCRLHKLGEDMTESLERVPASWFVIHHVREKFSCRACEAITQPPAPSHPIARGRAGPVLLAEIAFGKFCLHLPLHRQSRTFAREGVEIDVSTMADWMGGAGQRLRQAKLSGVTGGGAVSVALKPMVEVIEAHVLAAQRLHVDNTPVPVLAKGGAAQGPRQAKLGGVGSGGKTKTGRLWTVVRDDRPFGGADPPAAFYVYSPDRTGVHPEAFLRTCSGIMQADAYAGFGKLYEPGRLPGTIWKRDAGRTGVASSTRSPPRILWRWSRPAPNRFARAARSRHPAHRVRRRTAPPEIVASMSDLARPKTGQAGSRFCRMASF